MHRGFVDDAEALGVDLDRPPLRVAHVEVDFSVRRSRAQIHIAPIAIEVRLRHEGLDRRRHRFRGRRAVPFGVKEKPEP